MATETYGLSEAFSSVETIGRSALGRMTVEEFSTFERALEQLEVFLRETVQAHCADAALAALGHIENGKTLTKSDRRVIEQLLVADAKAYIEVEDNFRDWVDELRRLLADMDARSREVEPSVDQLQELRGLTRDAMRLVPSIRNYLDEQTRIDKFDASLESMDTQARQVLARLIRDQINRPDR
jgi:hypothetical protein